MLVSDDVSKQTKQIFENLKIILADADSNLDHVFKTTLFLENIKDFPAVNDIYKQCIFRIISL